MSFYEYLGIWRAPPSSKWQRIQLAYLYLAILKLCKVRQSPIKKIDNFITKRHVYLVRLSGQHVGVNYACSKSFSRTKRKKMPGISVGF